MGSGVTDCNSNLREKGVCGGVKSCTHQRILQVLCVCVHVCERETKRENDKEVIGSHPIFINYLLYMFCKELRIRQKQNTDALEEP